MDLIVDVPRRPLVTFGCLRTRTLTGAPCSYHWIPRQRGTVPTLHLVFIVLASATARLVFLSLEHNLSNCFLIAEAAFTLEAVLVVGAQFPVLGNE